MSEPIADPLETQRLQREVADKFAAAMEAEERAYLLACSELVERIARLSMLGSEMAAEARELVQKHGRKL